MMFRKFWKFLNGKKRRIALLAALAAQAIPDLAQASRKKLPQGIK